jgi:hypothetical protein
MGRYGLIESPSPGKGNSMSSILDPCQTFASNPNNRRRRGNGDLPQAERGPGRSVSRTDGGNQEKGETLKSLERRDLHRRWVRAEGLPHSRPTPDIILGMVITEPAGRPTSTWWTEPR